MYLPNDVRIVTEASGKNRAELEKVIHHYQSTGERDKLKADYFLIGNMDNKYAIGGEDENGHQFRCPVRSEVFRADLRFNGHSIVIQWSFKGHSMVIQ